VSTSLPAGSSSIIRKLEASTAFSDEERASFLSVPTQISEIQRGQIILREGDRPIRSFSILSGMTCNFKFAPTGRRQIVALHIEGDFPDLQSLHLNVLDFSLATLTPCRVAFIQHESLRSLCDRHPRISRALWREALIEAAIGREWLLNTGQRLGLSRLAHLFCELLVRMAHAGLSEDQGCACPLTQLDLADATGMSTVHVNRSLRELRSHKLIELRRGQLRVLRWEELKRVADFSAAYLHLSEEVPTAFF
jgi:CRP-like cAMP-binding protein